MRKLTKGERRALELALSDSLGSQGSGVQFATVLHLEALGLITYTAGMYKLGGARPPRSRSRSAPRSLTPRWP